MYVYYSVSLRAVYAGDFLMLIKRQFWCNLKTPVKITIFAVILRPYDSTSGKSPGNEVACDCNFVVIGVEIGSASL